MFSYYIYIHSNSVLFSPYRETLDFKGLFEVVTSCLRSMFYYKLSCSILFSSLASNSTAQYSGGSSISSDDEANTYYLRRFLSKTAKKLHKEIEPRERMRIPSVRLCIIQCSDGFSLSVTLVLYRLQCCFKLYTKFELREVGHAKNKFQQPFYCMLFF